MYKKLTITVDEDIYSGLYEVVGKGNISRFISKLVEPYVDQQKRNSAYSEMAKDTQREKEANDWSDNLLQDFE